MAGKSRQGGTTIVLKRQEGGGHGHHGGAWKVAYADFVTAMMAFFLLMWLLNATTEDQRRGIADFFAPANMLGQRSTGSGLPFGGRTLNSQGGLASDAGAVRLERGPMPVALDIEEEAEGEAPNPGQGQGQIPGPGQPAAHAREAAPEADAAGPGGEALPRPEALPEAELRDELERRERLALEQAAEQLRAAVRDDPALAELARQLLVEVVPEGLRIQLLDAERQPMFATGSAVPNERARALLQKVAQIAAALPNDLAIAGHTDATPFRGGERSNWELSADRANAVRRLLVETGIAEARIRTVAGYAERAPLLPDQPFAAANRRVAITLLRVPEEAAAR
ncbi:flagellar motor protein MotB [Crenalkalicoccus roseus]|uniref:flagellar motor protein MotB n=1 Tax=Crenalkalicoccus roseus TaxID=1485588 RepID=UPI00107FED34|nr:flagellar motor protein MotB [Crenalkalicoccus roseus]